MNSQTFEQKISGLEKRVGQLIKAYELEKTKSAQLLDTNKSLEQEIEALKVKISDFQNQDKIAKIVSSTTVEKDESVELKNKLDEYIKEIDRCIAHLS